MPGFSASVFTKGHIEQHGNSLIDAYDSSLGAYDGATNHSCNGTVETNSAAAGDFDIANPANICGNAFVGHGGFPPSVITNPSRISGTKAAQNPANVPLPDVAAPVLPNGLPFNPNISTTVTLAPNFNYGNLDVNGGTLILNAGVYSFTDFHVHEHATITVATGPVEIFLTGGQLHFENNVDANVAAGPPANLAFFLTSSAGEVHFHNHTTAVLGVYAPDSACTVDNNTDISGALTCNTAHIDNHASLHYDTQLNTYQGGGFVCPSSETSRASPVIASVDATDCVVQGTFVNLGGPASLITTPASVATWTFPFIQGHFRARTVASIVGSSGFSAGTKKFDTADPGNIPPAVFGGCASIDGSCRNVFTITQAPNPDGTNQHPPLVQLNDGTASAVGALITFGLPGFGPAQWTTIVHKILQAPLGGIDRSTAAVIPTSTLAGGVRATIAYVGGSDGMLHAVCASVGNGCPSLGVELWAFMPRENLRLLTTNTQRIDGSPRVIDAIINDTDVDSDDGGPHTISPRTVLLFQTGYRSLAPVADAAVYELDVTDPTHPYVVWETTAPGIPGAGLVTAVGEAHSDRVHNLAFVESNTGLTPGVAVTALRLETGKTQWQFNYPYPLVPGPRGVPGDLPTFPVNGIPGGAVGVDLANQGFVTDLLFGDLFGNLWRLDASTGADPLGANIPLFTFTTNHHAIGVPPALYSNGSQQFAAFTSGGYDDVNDTWTTGTQSVNAVKVSSTVTVHETDATCSTCNLSLHQTLAGFGGFAQAIIVGTQLFVTTDDNDVNLAGFGSTTSTGHLTTVNLATMASTTVVMSDAGASSLASSGTTLINSSGTTQSIAANATTTLGPSVSFANTARVFRNIWIRTE